MPEHSVKLFYFPLRCRAETARLLLAYSGTKYEDVTITFEQWPTMKEKMPMGQVPVLEVDGKQLCQSTAIARYLARECGLAGKNNWDMSRADMIVDGIFDMWGHLKDVYMPKFLQGDKKTADENWAKLSDSTLKTFLDKYTQFLKENGGEWFVGGSLTWADIAVAEFVAVLEDCFSPNTLDNHPQLKAFKEKIFSLPKLKEYVSQRPKTLF